MLMRPTGAAMSRKRMQAPDGLSDNAVTWFFVGLLVIAAIAGVLGQVG